MAELKSSYNLLLWHPSMKSCSLLQGLLTYSGNRKTQLFCGEYAQPGRYASSTLRVQVFCTKRNPNCMACPLRHDCDYARAEGRHLEPGLVRPKKAAPKKPRQHASETRAAMLTLPAVASSSMEGTIHGANPLQCLDGIFLKHFQHDAMLLDSCTHPSGSIMHCRLSSIDHLCCFTWSASWALTNTQLYCICWNGASAADSNSLQEIQPLMAGDAFPVTCSPRCSICSQA